MIPAAVRDMKANSRTRPPCALAAVGMVNALGGGLDEIWRGLLAADQSRLSRREGLVPNRALLVGEVREPLPEIPAALRRYACRNSALPCSPCARSRPRSRRWRRRSDASGSAW